MENNNSSKIFLDAPILGGLFMAFFSVMPIISALNVLCCMWLILGGALSYIIASKKENYVAKSSDGLIYGALSGVFGWIFNAVLTFLLMGIKAKKLEAIKEKFLNMNTPEAQNIVSLLERYNIKLIVLIFSFAFIIFYLIFPTIGGAIAQSLSKKEKKEKNNREISENSENEKGDEL